jgi:hypothetical protein
LVILNDGGYESVEFIEIERDHHMLSFLMWEKDFVKRQKRFLTFAFSVYNHYSPKSGCRFDDQIIYYIINSNKNQIIL